MMSASDQTAARNVLEWRNNTKNDQEQDELNRE